MEFIVDDDARDRRESRIYCAILLSSVPVSAEFQKTLDKWPGLKSFIRVKYLRINKTGEKIKQFRFFASSLEYTAEAFSKVIRKHWEVENKLHWVLDVAMREDECRMRVGFSAENFSTVRHIVLNLLRKEPSKKSIRRKQNQVSWDDFFLEKIVFDSQSETPLDLETGIHKLQELHTQFANIWIEAKATYLSERTSQC